MKEEVNIEETLWSYIDGGTTAEETSFVEGLLEANTTWKAKYKELLEMHALMLESTELEQPSMRFTQNVMEEISRLYITPAASKYINKNVIRGIGLFFAATIIGLIGYVFGETDWSATTSVPGLDKIEIGSFDWSKLYSSAYTNVFMMVNIILALMLLDMHLDRKKKSRAASNP